MARTALTVTDTVLNGGVTPTTTAVDPTNGHSIDAGGVGRILIVVNNTAGATKVATVKAGVNPPAQAQSLGDITFTVPASTNGVVLGPFETARIAQADGKVNLDLAAGITGTIAVLRISKH